MVATTRPFDPASLLTTDVARAEFLSESFGSSDPAIIADALGIVARAAGLAELTARAGLGRGTICCPHEAIRNSPPSFES